MKTATPPSKEALILLVIPESRSDIRDPVPQCINALPHRHWVPAFAGMTKREIDQTFPNSNSLRPSKSLSNFEHDVNEPFYNGTKYLLQVIC